MVGSWPAIAVLLQTSDISAIMKIDAGREAKVKCSVNELLENSRCFLMSISPGNSNSSAIECEVDHVTNYDPPFREGLMVKEISS